MTKITTKRQDAEAFIGRTILRDLETGKVTSNGKIDDILSYTHYLFKTVSLMPQEDIGTNAHDAAVYATFALETAVFLATEDTEDENDS